RRGQCRGPCASATSCTGARGASWAPWRLALHLQQALIRLIPAGLRVAAPDRLAVDAPGASAVHRSLRRGQPHGSGETLQTRCAAATAVATTSTATSPNASNRPCHL